MIQELSFMCTVYMYMCIHILVVAFVRVTRKNSQGLFLENQKVMNGI